MIVSRCNIIRDFVAMKENEFSRSCFQNALIMLCWKHLLNEVSVTMLCKAAGYNRSTFYRNYRIVEDVLKEKIRQLMDEYHDSFRKMSLGRRQSIVFLFSFYRKNGEVFALMHKAHLDSMLMESILENFPADIRPSENSYDSIFITGGYLSVILHWIDTGMRESNEEMADCLMRMFS